MSPPPAPSGAATPAFAKLEPQLGALGQSGVGAVMVVWVSASTESKSTSALRPTVTVPWIGSTQAKEVGLPVYSIWS